MDVDGVKVQVEQDGIFDLSAINCFWPAFYARAVDYDKRFISETGYRNFSCIYSPIEPNILPDDFARSAIRTHLKREHNGEPYPIEQKYVDREKERRQAAEDHSR